jgi:hypothetical protein
LARGREQAVEGEHGVGKIWSKLPLLRTVDCGV